VRLPPAAWCRAGGRASAREDGAGARGVRDQQPAARAQMLDSAEISDYSQRMDQAKVAQVRRFNRVVTQHVGALNERYLARAHSLGEARVLWEIGSAGCDVRTLRVRLGLDSGYLSRLLGTLVEAGLVTLGPSADDRRIRTARLTPAGLLERAVLDERSDSLAESLLAALNPAQRRRLCASMSEVERLITAATVAVAEVDPARRDAQQCLHAYFAELNRRFETGFDPAHSISAGNDELRVPAGLLVLAWLRERPVGCGAMKFHGDQPAELKRMWVAESARGLGIGRSPKPSVSTARPGTSRCRRSTTSRTRTTGSRSNSADRGRRDDR
jgi:DNA-binding MarR family transcriptional regulator/GNAT superfamily N-acetyltransferase